MENNKNPEIINDGQNKELTSEELEKTNGGFDIFSIFKGIASSSEQLRSQDFWSNNSDE